MSSMAGTSDPKHISVCICTYKRPSGLRRLLSELSKQDTNGNFTYSIVVADNDQSRSAETVVADFAAASSIPVRYCVEPRQSIALARNKVVENATGDFVAFIDDDEFPTPHWLVTLFAVCNQYCVDGVLGPVLPHFDETTPGWVRKGGFYDRPVHATGLVVKWQDARSGNVLLKRHVLTACSQPFRSEFRSGEDQDFFRRMIQRGHSFIWCSDAVAYEVVPPMRWKRGYLLRRALLRGTMNRIQPTLGALSIAKSVIAVPAYIVAMPFALVLGHHRFMAVLVRLCDHLGKLLAVLGINPIRDQYVTE
jgi:succinoglycan biosynthesis protein ExoM